MDNCNDRNGLERIQMNPKTFEHFDYKSILIMFEQFSEKEPAAQ